MTIIRAGDAVLVMRRPADDYLYPNSWTIPGGYLDAGELPVTAAAREIAEETGLFIKPEALFGGEPVMSDRLAAFCFIAHIGTPQTLHMSEHDAYRFIHLADVPRLELTREARLILERYLAVSEPVPRYLSEMSGAS
ncbi:MAG: NUDIX hydrolase [Alphaproteobacteria bacterium]|nr:NUDIX hydrolase [Alphaproteobacteria bacterium]